MGVRQKGRIFRAIAWRSVEREPFLHRAPGALDLAFSLTQNTFNGETYTELTLADVRAAERQVHEMRESLLSPDRLLSPSR